MIINFHDETTKDIYDGTSTTAARRVPKAIWSTAKRKLDMLDAAREPRDLRAPPGNRLEKLVGNLEGFWSVRINDQFRLIFTFAGGNASDVMITDYH